MAESTPIPPIDYDNPALFQDRPPGDPSVEWNDHERFVALIEGLVAATVLLIGTVLVTSCGNLVASAPGVAVCTYPFVLDGTVAIYLSVVVVCVAIARPTQSVFSTASNVVSARYGALALFFAATLVFAWALLFGL